MKITFDNEEEIEEIKNCMICNKELETQEKILKSKEKTIKGIVFKNTYLISFANCDDYIMGDGSSTFSSDDFEMQEILLCDTCFKDYGIKALNILKVKK